MTEKEASWAPGAVIAGLVIITGTEHSDITGWVVTWAGSMEESYWAMYLCFGNFNYGR